MSIREENNVIKEIISLWYWLEERNESGSIKNTNALLE
jgi:hypothetical protein